MLVAQEIHPAAAGHEDFQACRLLPRGFAALVPNLELWGTLPTRICRNGSAFYDTFIGNRAKTTSPLVWMCADQTS